MNFCIWRERCSTFGAPGWPLAWLGPQDGLGQGGPRLKWAKGQFGSKNEEKVKVVRMEFSIVENLSGLQEIIFSLCRGPQLNFGEESKSWSNFIEFIDFPLFPLFGVPWAAVIIYELTSSLVPARVEGRSWLAPTTSDAPSRAE